MYIRDTLFVLNKEQEQQKNRLKHLNHYFHMLRPNSANSAFVLDCVMDCWVYYFFEETPIIDSKRGFIQIARKQIIEWGCEQPLLKRIKMSTKGEIEKALLAAILTVNVLVDIIREVLSKYSQKEQDLLKRYLGQNDSLFQKEYAVIETYPKRIVRLETKITRELIESLEQLDASILKQVKTFIDRYGLIEKEMFAGRKVPFKHL